MAVEFRRSHRRSASVAPTKGVERGAIRATSQNDTIIERFVGSCERGACFSHMVLTLKEIVCMAVTISDVFAKTYKNVSLRRDNKNFSISRLFIYCPSWGGFNFEVLIELGDFWRACLHLRVRIALPK
jgi:hypothetical protein